MPKTLHKREIEYTEDEGHPWDKDNQGDTEIYQSSNLKDQGLLVPGEFIYGKSLKWYFEVMVWPMFILLIIEIGIRVMQTKYLATYSADIFTWIINLARVLMFVYLTIVAVKQFKAVKKQVLTTAVIGGVVAGVILAIFQLLWYFELWTFFNLLRQPLLLGVEGLIISWLVLVVFKRKLRV